MRNLLAICLAFGLSAGLASCGGTSTPSPSDDGGASSGDGGGTKAALGDTCQVNTDCDSGLCFIGGKQSYCSLACTTDTAATDCATPPFNGVCNNQGFCRKP